jgi:hypothetical protein
VFIFFPITAQAIRTILFAKATVAKVDGIVESTSPKRLQSEQAMTFWLGKAIHSSL